MKKVLSEGEMQILTLKKDREKYRRRRNNLEAYTFVGPYLLGTLVFFIAPLVFSFYISLGEYKLVQTGNTFQFLGFTHYIKSITQDAFFTKILWQTISTMATNAPLIIIFSLVIAIILNKNMMGKGAFRTLFFLPFLLGTGYVMKQLLGMNAVGGATDMARSIILPYEIQNYIGPQLTTIFSQFFSTITWILWRSGVQIVLFLGGLQAISASLYESARVDSATEWEIFWKITLPMITPTMLLVMIYTIIDSFTDPLNPMISLFNDITFTFQEWSRGAAISWLYFAVIIVIVGLVFAIMKRFTHKEYEI